MPSMLLKVPPSRIEQVRRLVREHGRVHLIGDAFVYGPASEPLEGSLRALGATDATEADVTATELSAGDRLALKAHLARAKAGKRPTPDDGLPWDAPGKEAP